MSAPKSQATKTAKAEASVSSVADIKKRRNGILLALPSGITIKARKVELRTFLDSPTDVPNPLLAVVEEAINKGQGMDMDKIIGKDGVQVDLSMVREMYDMVDKVVIAVCVEPQVHPNPEDEADRDDDLLYADEFDEEDKMFLFQWCQGGTSDIAQFRRETEQGLASLVKS